MQERMKLQAPRRRNPFDNPLLKLVLHAFALIAMIAAIYFSIMRQSWTPVAIGFVVLATLDGVWLYFFYQAIVLKAIRHTPRSAERTVPIP